MPRWLYALLFFTLITVIIEVLHLPIPSPLLFILAALGIVPVAALIGQAVEQVAEHTGERVGGLLFATFGNATELIIGIFALHAGLIEVVRASIIGSILGNALLVLGVSTFIGAVKGGHLHFESRPASQYASLLTLCMGGLVLPTFAELLAAHQGYAHALVIQDGILLSDWIAILLLIGYVASILFSVFRLGDTPGDEQDDEFDPVVGERSTKAIMRLLAYRHHLARSTRKGKTAVLNTIDKAVVAIVNHEAGQQTGASLPSAIDASTPVTPPVETVTPAETSAVTQPIAATTPRAESGKRQASAQPMENRSNLWLALLLLIAATATVGWLSDILVNTIEPLTVALHWNAAFVGLIFIPLIGGLPEYFNTISMALEKRMSMVLAASAGSSIQIALLLAPILVLVSLATPMHLDLVFSIVELAVLALATFLFSEITRDGELVWLEGLLLILLYTMMGTTVFIFGS